MRYPLSLLALTTTQVVHTKYSPGGDGNTFTFQLDGLPSGIYIVHFPGIPAQRIIIPQ